MGTPKPWVWGSTTYELLWVVGYLLPEAHVIHGIPLRSVQWLHHVGYTGYGGIHSNSTVFTSGLLPGPQDIGVSHTVIVRIPMVRPRMGL